MTRASSFGKNGSQFGKVEGPVRRPQLDIAANGPAEERVGPVILVERLEDDHFVTRIEQREHARDHTLGCSAAHGDLALGINFELIKTPVVLADGVAKRFRAPGNRVLVHIGGNGLLSGSLDFVGRREIGKALRQVDCAMLEREARHLADH